MTDNTSLPTADDVKGILAPAMTTRDALIACREFVAGMNKPMMAGVHSISSYHPCQALIDKIDAALSQEPEAAGRIYGLSDIEAERDRRKAARELANDVIIAYFDEHGINDAKAGAFNILDRLKDAGLTVAALAPTVGTGREGLTEAAVMKTIMSNFGGKVWDALTTTIGKRSTPTPAVMHFARDLAALAQPTAPGGREDLRRLVDIVWRHATESTAVPFTKTADMLIDRAGLAISPQNCRSPADQNIEMVLHPLSDIRELDAVVAELGIQDSDITPAEAVRELNAEIERLRATPAPSVAGAERAAVIEECVKVVDRWVLDVTRAGDQFDRNGDIYQIAGVLQKLAAELRALATVAGNERTSK